MLGLLGVALLVALAPFATGLIGIPVLYVILRPVHERLAPRLGQRISAALVVALALLLLVLPGMAFAGLLIGQAQEIAEGLAASPLQERLARVRFAGADIGPFFADLGTAAVRWLGGSALGLIGTATRQALNLLVALFGLYYLLLRSGETWTAVSQHIPFSPENIEKLRSRFRNVAASTVIGTGLVAVIQGSLVGLGLQVAGLPNALFWGLVTVILSVLPVVGSGLVWAPAVVILLLDQRTGAAVLLALWGLLVVGNVDYLIRPMLFRRWAHIHPITTLVGALAGVPYFGILGLLIGPLALSYFFELLAMYREEYGGARPADPYIRPS